MQRQQLLRPFPQFTGVFAQALNDGSSYFHMLQARMEKRFSSGVQFLANYQFSKLLERRSRLNDVEAPLEKRVANEDRPQRFVLSASYYLPFGKGRRFGASVHPVAGKIISGWVINGIFVIQPGPALDWGNVIYLGGDLQLNPRQIDGAFDTTRFVTNSREQREWNIRRFPSRFGNLRQDGLNNFDFSILKDSHITETVYLQFRCEFFNAVNHPTFQRAATEPSGH